jgi:ATP-dependent helicase HrpA
MTVDNPLSEACAAELSFPENLPVSARRDDIKTALNTHQVVIVCGENGSSKTTQLPKIALAAGHSRGGTLGKTGMTQPRRISAKALRINDSKFNTTNRTIFNSCT